MPRERTLKDRNNQLKIAGTLYAWNTKDYWFVRDAFGFNENGIDLHIRLQGKATPLGGLLIIPAEEWEEK